MTEAAGVAVTEENEFGPEKQGTIQTKIKDLKDIATALEYLKQAPPEVKEKFLTQAAKSQGGGSNLGSSGDQSEWTKWFLKFQDPAHSQETENQVGALQAQAAKAAKVDPSFANVAREEPKTV
ncbi:MAG: hypothetical protein GF390_02315 [Candidatus Pacebacteria bacterium]|nr:hypothetical protein [Candidatus Paceibacterota bacterium]